MRQQRLRCRNTAEIMQLPCQLPLRLLQWEWLRELPQKLLLLLWLSCSSWLDADTIVFRAEQVSSTTATGRERTQLQGDVFVDVNDSSIETDNLDIFGKDRDILVAKGNVYIDNRKQKLEIKGQELFYNRKTKLLRMRGNIDLEDKDNEVIVFCNFTEYDEDLNTAKMQVNVRIFSEDIMARSEYAVYSRETQIIELSGAPIVHKGEDVYQGSRIFVNLDTKDITIDNGVEGKIITQDDSGENSDDKESE